MTPFVRRSLLVIGVAIIARLFFVLYSHFPAGDSGAYVSIALNLLDGHGFAIDPRSPTVFRAPVYPLFIAGVYAIAGHFPGFVLLAQAFVGGLAAWCVYLLGRRLLSENVALAGALLAGAYPHLAWYSATILSETVAFFFLALTMLGASFLRRDRVDARLALLVGAGFAVTALTAPRLAALPLALGAALLLRGVPFARVFATLAVAGIGYSAVLAPWVVRNLITFGLAIPLVVGMQGAVYWLPTYRVGLYDYQFDRWAREEPLMARWVGLYYTEEGVAREREQIPQRIELEGELFVDAWRRITTDPGGYLAHQSRVMPALWVQPAAYVGNFKHPFAAQNQSLEKMIAERQWPSVLARGASILVFTVGLFGGLALGLWTLRRRWREIALLLAPAAYVVVFQSFAYIEHRFSILAHPFLWLLAAAGWGALIQAVARRSRRRAAPAASPSAGA